jgi:hypothetical protein
MSEKTWERNTTGLAAYTHQRKEHKYKQAEEAITTLLREHKEVNFTSVARVAGVTKAYLYNQPLLRDRIEALRQREQQENVYKQTSRPAGKTDVGKDMVILAKDRRIKALEAENSQLKKELRVALGKAYDRL